MAINPFSESRVNTVNSVVCAIDAAAADVNWISGQAPDGPIRCCAKVRYRQTEQPATVTPRPDGGADILFDEPQRAITPGQAAVFYDGDVVLGGGVLE